MSIEFTPIKIDKCMPFSMKFSAKGKFSSVPCNAIHFSIDRSQEGIATKMPCKVEESRKSVPNFFTWLYWIATDSVWWSDLSIRNYKFTSLIYCLAVNNRKRKWAEAVLFPIIIIISISTTNSIIVYANRKLSFKSNSYHIIFGRLIALAKYGRWHLWVYVN